MKKYTIHVPVEQYGFISAEFEGTAEDAINEYNEVKHSIGFGDGMSEKDFRQYYDNVASGGEINGDPGLLGQMSMLQKYAINEAKKFLDRKAGIKNQMNNYKPI